ncbi:MAG: 4a-hydroxytetrahydrobiopterin dehydratase [Tepidisphaeraceae bacterium]|jgi:4a-hydroxytetrahydrobiopterin dehydratase
MKSALAEKKCKACRPGTAALSEAEIGLLLPEILGWQSDNGEIFKTFNFKDYHHTMAFVNAVAWVSHQQDHHPDMEVGYNRCKVRYSTHSVGGLSENDFICAAKVESLFDA